MNFKSRNFCSIRFFFEYLYFIDGWRWKKNHNHLVYTEQPTDISDAKKKTNFVQLHDTRGGDNSIEISIF